MRIPLSLIHISLEEEAKIRDYIDQANIIVEGDLRRNVALDIKRLVEIQSFLALFALAISQILLTSSC